MKIVVVGTRGFPDVPGGVEKHCQELYPRLVALGCDVTVLARTPYVGHKPFVYEGVQIIPLPCPRHKYLEAAIHTFLGMFKARLLNADIVHIHGIGPSLFVPLARMLGLKVIVTHHGPDYNRHKWGPIAKRCIRLGERFAAIWTHHVIVIQQYIAQTLEEKFNCQSTVIPNGVVVHDEALGQEALKMYGLTSRKYILALGRFVPEKGFNDLLDSFHKFSSECDHDWKLVIVGDADHEDAYSQRIKTRGNAMDNVILTGYLSGLPLQEIFSHAGLFVLPSYHEGLPISLLEALSYGTSCLVSDIPANRAVELEEDRYFKPGDIAALSDKIKIFVERPRSEDQRRNRREYVRQRYDWSKIAQQTNKIYEKVISWSFAVSPGLP